MRHEEEQLRDLGNQIEQTLKGSALEAASLFHKALSPGELLCKQCGPPGSSQSCELYEPRTNSYPAQLVEDIFVPQAIESIGLTPMKVREDEASPPSPSATESPREVSEDAASTTSGPTDSQEAHQPKEVMMGKMMREEREPEHRKRVDKRAESGRPLTAWRRWSLASPQ